MKHFSYLLVVLCVPVQACLFCALPTPLPTSIEPAQPSPAASTSASQVALPPPTASQSLPTSTPGLPDPATLHRPQKLQIGLNFIRFYLGEESYYQPETIFADFQALDIHAYRQIVRADLRWDDVEPQDDQWNFTAADAVLTNSDFEPIVTLFTMQFASPTPPWVKDAAQFEKTLGPEAEEYLETVITRYGPYVKYWELGNEMDHWRAADSSDQPQAEGKPPPLSPPGGFSPQEQGVFLAQAAAFIRARDPDAVIVMPGMSNLNDDVLNDWLAGVIEGGGTDWFDVVNYHYYSSWEPYTIKRRNFQTFLERAGLVDKPVWLTETGATASPTLTARTNYPNSPEAQAADIFRRIIQAYGAGDDLVMWHAYISSPDLPTNDWRLYGIRSDQGEAHPSYYAFKLLIQELIPFSRVEALAADPRQVNVYRITTEAGETKYVLWGKGTCPTPAGMTQMVSVIPEAGGHFAWQVPPAQIELATNPVLLK